MSNKQATILFADIAGCAEVSNNHGLEDYAQFLKGFHEAAILARKSVLSSYKEPEEMEFSVRGDEVCLILHSKDDGNSIKEDVQRAILYAIILKLNWLLSKYNQTRVNNSLTPRDLGIGIHHGPVYFDIYPDNIFGGNNIKSSEGYSINFTKRIEGCSRKGRFSKIFVSKEIEFLANRELIKFRDGEQFDLKGITTQPYIYEIENVEHIETFLSGIEIKEPSQGFPFTAREKYIKTSHIHANNLWLKDLLLFFFNAIGDSRCLELLITKK